MASFQWIDKYYPKTSYRSPVWDIPGLPLKNLPDVPIDIILFWIIRRSLWWFDILAMKIQQPFAKTRCAIGSIRHLNGQIP